MKENATDMNETSVHEDVQNALRREALKKLVTLGIAAAAAPAMMTLLQATQASAQSGTVQPPV